MRHPTRLLVLALFATLFTACGDPNADSATTGPQITYFGATNAKLPKGGGPVTLTWSDSDATAMSIDNGIGSVLGLSQKTVTVTKTTTFVLTATDETGTTQIGTTINVTPKGTSGSGSSSGSTGGTVTSD